MIPSLDPDEKLLNLLENLSMNKFSDIVLINDGSDATYDSFFEIAVQKYGCKYLKNHVNMGKGRALKNAFNYALEQFPHLEMVITVDADGQHLVGDIRSVCQEALLCPEQMILGCRNFTDKTRIPLRSRLGNVATSKVLALLCGITLSDTQTGLRAIPKHALQEFLTVEGERFEYETNMLLKAKEIGLILHEIPIETVYIEENRTSHFNPLRDSFKIYTLLLRFSMSSLFSFLVDISLFQLFLNMQVENIMIASYSARVISVVVNYLLNKNKVFRVKEKSKFILFKYLLLCVIQITISAVLVKGFYHLLPFNITVLKVIIDTLLFFASFYIQRKWVFRR